MKVRLFFFSSTRCLRFIVMLIEPTTVVCSIVITFLSISISKVDTTVSKHVVTVNANAKAERAAKRFIGSTVHTAAKRLLVPVTSPQSKPIVAKSVASMQATKPKTLLLLKSFKVAKNKQKADARSKAAAIIRISTPGGAKKQVIAKLNLKPIVIDTESTTDKDVDNSKPDADMAKLLAEMVKVLKEKLHPPSANNHRLEVNLTTTATTIVEKLNTVKQVSSDSFVTGDTAELMAEMVKILKDKFLQGTGLSKNSPTRKGGGKSALSPGKKLKMAINKLPKQKLQKNGYGFVYPLPYEGMEGLQYLPLIYKDSVKQGKRPAHKKLALFSLDTE